jgi:hypothetical protein
MGATELEFPDCHSVAACQFTSDTTSVLERREAVNRKAMMMMMSAND